MKYILFGAGVVGREALSMLGRWRVVCFIDNDPKKQNTRIDGVPVYPSVRLPSLLQDARILVTTDYLESAHEFLKGLGVTDYQDYEDYKRSFFRERNLWAQNWHQKYTHRARNRRILDFAAEAEGLDTIQNPSAATALFERIVEINRREGNNEWYYRDLAWESRNFGHINEIFSFAGISLEKSIYLPNIEHGVNFMGTYWDRPASITVFGSKRQQHLQERLPGKPIFTIGPPIAYARPFYTREQQAEIKRQWGRTLLVFSAHSYESATCHFDGAAYAKEVFERYGGAFKSIVACVFYSDLFGPFAKAMEALGARIVCAGFRFDRCFIRRLRSLLELSDGVVTNGLGTQIGYALYLNKPVEILPEQVDYQLYTNSFTQRQLLDYGAFVAAFSPQGFQISPQQRALAEEWWGFSHIRSKAELAALVEVNRRIALAARGELVAYNRSALSVLETLSRERGTTAALGERLLRAAIFGNSTRKDEMRT